MAELLFSYAGTMIIAAAFLYHSWSRLKSRKLAGSLGHLTVVVLCGGYIILATYIMCHDFVFN